MQCVDSSSCFDSTQMDAIYASLKQLVPPHWDDLFCLVEESIPGQTNTIKFTFKGSRSGVLLFVNDLMSNSFNFEITEMLFSSDVWYVSAIVAYLSTDKSGKIHVRTKTDMKKRFI